MNYLQYNSDSSKMDAISSFLRLSYDINNNCAGFITEQTSLFIDHKGNKFMPYYKQVEFMNLLPPKYRVIVINKCRQSGFSTSIVGKSNYSGYFNKCPEIVTLSATRTQAEKILDRIKKTFLSMNEIIRPNFVRENKSQLELKNGVVIYSLSSNPDSARGYTGDVFIDEYAMLGKKDAVEIYRATYPSTTIGGRIIIVSTPKGIDHKFYELITKPSDNTKVYNIYYHDVPHVLHAIEHENLFMGLSQQDIDQEYKLIFLVDSEEMFFSENFLFEKLLEKTREIPLFTDLNDFTLPEYYLTDFTIPNKEEYQINNMSFYYNVDGISQTHIKDIYRCYYAGWDVASTRDDSVLTIIGERRDKPEHVDVVGEFILNQLYGSDLIQQSKVVSRIMDIFQIERLAIDNKGLGRGCSDYLCSIENLTERIDRIEFNTQNKIDMFSHYKNMLNENKFKKRYDGMDWENKRIKQHCNVFISNNLIKQSGGKDDIAYGSILALRAKQSNIIEGGFYLV